MQSRVTHQWSNIKFNWFQIFKICTKIFQNCVINIKGWQCLITNICFLRFLYLFSFENINIGLDFPIIYKSKKSHIYYVISHYIYIYISNILLIKKSNDVINLQIITKKKKTQIYVNKTTINRHGYTSNSTLSIQSYSKPSNQYYYVLLTKQAKKQMMISKTPKI